MDQPEIKKYLLALNDELAKKNVTGEICLYGGAVMCLVFDARPSTKDVDAIFAPTQEIRLAAEQVAQQQYDLRPDWINDAVKGFVVSGHPQKILLNNSNLKVYVPEPDYLLAMKALASRVDGPDRQDLLMLIKHLQLKTPQDVFEILEKYYPRNQIKPATKFFIEEIFQQ